MSKVWYGSLNNRLEENKMYCEKIEEGTGMTEYFYSDSHAYEVVKVINQKDVFVREYDAVPVGEPMSNEWKLISNPNKPIREIKFRYGHWNWVSHVTKESIKNIPVIDSDLYDKVMKNGKVTVYHKTRVSFGISQYYYDYEF